jgi:hypothetical protein
VTLLEENQQELQNDIALTTRTDKNNPAKKKLQKESNRKIYWKMMKQQKTKVTLIGRY